MAQTTYKAERIILEHLAGEDEQLASEAVLRYLNRASDLVFAMARFADVDDPELFEGREAGTADD